MRSSSFVQVKLHLRGLKCHAFASSGLTVLQDREFTAISSNFVETAILMNFSPQGDLKIAKI